MPSTDFFPRTDPKVLQFCDDFPTRLATYAATLSFTPARLVLIDDTCKDMKTFIQTSENAKSVSKDATLAKDINLATFSAFIRSLAKEIKANPAYTPNMGQGLEIVGTENPVDPVTYQTTISAEVFMGYINLKFTKKGVEGVNVYVRIKGTLNWTKLSFDSHSPYVDNRPLTVPNVPEVREYMCIGVMDDHEIGQPSNIVTVTFAG
jgi:hypothetical protein